MEQHPAIESRVQVVRAMMTARLIKAEGAVDTPHDADLWFTAAGMSDLDRLSGFTHPTVARSSIGFRYCPAVLAKTTLDLPWSPDVADPRFYRGPGERPASLFFADNYIRAVADLLIGEAIEARKGVKDPLRRRQLAEDALDKYRCPGVLDLLTYVQLRVLEP